MEHLDYYEYEKKKTMDKLRKTGGAKTLKSGFSLLRMALKILKSSIVAEHPKIKPARLRQEIRKFLWHPQR